MDDALRAAQHAAETDPADASVRLAYAAALLRAGYRASAWHELAAAQIRGARAPELEGAFTVENPAGRVWSFQSPRRSPGGVAPPAPDALVADTSVWWGGRSLPLVLVLGRACTECDDGWIDVPGHPRATCPECDGTGEVPDSIDNYVGDPFCMAPCPTCRDTVRAPCRTCFGTRFRVANAERPCTHQKPGPEERYEAANVALDELVLVRCTECGRATLSCGAQTAVSCRRCGLFDCRSQHRGA